MWSLFSLAFLITGVVATSAETIAAFASYHEDKQFLFELDRVQMESTPSWDENQQNPPISARHAFNAARKRLATLVSMSEKWDLIEIVLRPMPAPTVGKWIYVVKFRPPVFSKDPKGSVSTVDLIVLMDGIALQPTIAPVKKANAAPDVPPF